ncbi:DUF72 domain-containing protein [Methylobacillus arboreus]|uniref:DUF72 domain-containing protein n=1 Tax=Methylobacillus arboreus TaxID=755170 RepID=UPI001E45DFA3|nr:DUF72 domain-containing protein [Methylobacillus arboreus]MCB5191124.1 DUF72 domain-containing protein [Methylobacillus arboreus]
MNTHTLSIPDQPALRVGCAGWGIPPQHATLFPQGGSHLERYARLFNMVEINSSFYRPHQHKTYVRWADTVPDNFRFWIKMPGEITHRQRLADCSTALRRFLEEISGLGSKLGGILIQLPPSLPLEAATAHAFFTLLRHHYPGAAACEPRHASWFTIPGENLLKDFSLARVAADPARFPMAGVPGGWSGFCYYRLHGTPQIYYSSYPPEYLEQLSITLQNANKPAWCIFDNTARGAAAANAFAVKSRTQLLAAQE